MTHVLYCFSLQVKAYGYYLFEEAVRKLQLLEADYFDLEYVDHQGNAVSIISTQSLDTMTS